MTQGMTASMDKFISDPHLGHENKIKFERTQFKSIEEHETPDEFNNSRGEYHYIEDEEQKEITFKFNSELND